MTFQDLLEQHQVLVRLGCFVGVFSTLALLERVRPRRRLTASKPRRWGINLAVTGLSTLSAQAVVWIGALGATGAALLAGEHGWGLLNRWAGPAWAEWLITLIALDCVIYWQHRAFHAVGWLWRIHRMHHADLDLDVTSGGRFHPAEIVLSLFIKMGAVLALGAPVGAVVLFEVVLNATSMFNHANLALPEPLDRVLRWLVVTPDMHRVHHSVIRRETDSNFGFNLPWWDRLFRSYRDQPEAGHHGMRIGLEELREERQVGLGQLLAMPLAGSRQRRQR